MVDEENPLDLAVDALKLYPKPFIEQNHLYSIELYLDSLIRWYVDSVQNSLVHILFKDAIKCGKLELYLAGCITLCTGFEASIKHELLKTNFLKHISDPKQRLKSMPNLGDKLLRKAHEFNLPVSHLLLQQDSLDDLKTGRIRLVSLRNDICHGNFSSFAVKVDENQGYFTRECVADIYFELVAVSIKWLDALNRANNNPVEMYFLKTRVVHDTNS
jgi:hypothetical protein